MSQNDPNLLYRLKTDGTANSITEGGGGGTNIKRSNIGMYFHYPELVEMHKGI
jgi:hypothetical protein